MKRKLCLICSILGILGGILILIAAFLENAFPKPLWVVAAVCCCAGAGSSLTNFASVVRKKK